MTGANPAGGQVCRLLGRMVLAVMVLVGVSACGTGSDTMAQAAPSISSPPAARPTSSTIHRQNAALSAHSRPGPDDRRGDRRSGRLRRRGGRAQPVGPVVCPCRSEADDLERAYETTRDLGVQFLGINVRDPQRDKAQDFVIDNNVSYPSIYDPPMATLTALGGSSG